MSPNIAVDAPTLQLSGLKTQENRIPPKPEKKYKENSLQNPNPFSRPEPITIVERMFRAKCMKLA